MYNDDYVVNKIIWRCFVWKWRFEISDIVWFERKNVHIDTCQRFTSFIIFSDFHNKNQNKLIVQFTMSFAFFNVKTKIVQMQWIKHIYSEFLYHVC